MGVIGWDVESETQSVLEASTASNDGKIHLLITIPGIDYYSALLIVTELGDIDWFGDENSVCKYSGLVPRVRQSSGSLKMGGITKEGESTLRWILTTVSEVIIKYKNPMRDLYRKIYKRSRSKKPAKTATERKVLVMIYTILKNNEPCRWSDPILTERKIASLQKISKREVLVE